MVFERAGDAAREEVAINGEGGARGNFGRIGLAHDDRAKRAHFAMEQADGVAVAIVAAKAVRAHHFGERVALMRGRHVAASAHFGEADAVSRLAELPGGFVARDDAGADWLELSPLTGCSSDRVGGKESVRAC